jgi:hypothetical protein
MTGSQKLQDDMDADEAGSAGDQNSAHCQIPLIAPGAQIGSATLLKAASGHYLRGEQVEWISRPVWKT